MRLRLCVSLDQDNDNCIPRCYVAPRKSQSNLYGHTRRASTRDTRLSSVCVGRFRQCSVADYLQPEIESNAVIACKQSSCRVTIATKASKNFLGLLPSVFSTVFVVVVKCYGLVQILSPSSLSHEHSSPIEPTQRSRGRSGIRPL
ncbi:hypothetical protein BU25DRAFT_217077 [Macroventuria anomochaeta]|uniref:Uncharacterized protein n=1 Tax=Macroventuria anomochaeta TaxID=301207 RepID=A0ACB6RJK1_9PLEO|nr:uncharacterized protein BU25DRAFT_217077 [Macroventuria anomochaeta]KAF2622176.1 hypothetical protein BU25DRAFT_217077 [Macroventuria anomochaeta]